MKVSFAKPIINEEMIEAAKDALVNEKLVQGESVYKFEEEFAKFIGVKYAVAVNSGTSALILAFLALKINGKKFIAPSATFISTVSAGIISGGSIIFNDINLKTYTLDTETLESKIRSDKENIKAIVPVHLYGYPANMDIIRDIAYSHEISIIEDAAQAHGAEYKGKRVGSLGDIGIFSFYPIKNMTVGGDGGMLVTNNEEYAELAKKLRDCGRSAKYIHDELGYVFRMNTINAAIGRIQLKYLNKWNEKRRKIAALYDKLLKDIEEIILPPRPKLGVNPVYHLYVIRLKEYSIRNALGAWLTSNNIEVLIHYPVPIHQQPAINKMNIKFSLKNTEVWAKTVLSLPMHPELKNEEIEYVTNKIREFFEKKIYDDETWIARGEEWLKRSM